MTQQNTSFLKASGFFCVFQQAYDGTCSQGMAQNVFNYFIRSHDSEATLLSKEVIKTPSAEVLETFARLEFRIIPTAEKISRHRPRSWQESALALTVSDWLKQCIVDWVRLCAGGFWVAHREQCTRGSSKSDQIYTDVESGAVIFPNGHCCFV